MPQRLLEYNMRAREVHGLDVYSYVIYLRDVGEVPLSPLRWTAGDKEVLQFHYQVVELYKMNSEEFRQMSLTGLLPLVLLTKDGATRETAEEVISELEAADKLDAAGAAAVLASLVLKSKADQEWFKRRAGPMYEKLIEESWFAQELVQRAVEKARREDQQVLEVEHQKLEVEHQKLEAERQKLEAEHRAREAAEARREMAEARVEQSLQLLRQALISIVQVRFTDSRLIRIAKKEVGRTQDLERLRDLFTKVSEAQSAEQAEDALLGLDEVDEGDN